MAEISSADHIVELPVWLNKDFVQKILRDDLQNDSLTVHDLQIEPAVPKGQNFSSILFRVSAEFTLNSGRVDKVKMIIKTQLQADDNVAVIMKELNSFSVEIYAYQILLAKVHELLRSIGDDTVLAPRCLAVDSDIGYLVFEDLSADAYSMVDRSTGFTAELFRSVLEKLAKWHAATGFLLDKDPSIASQCKSERFDSQSPWRLFFENTITTLIEYTSLNPEFAHIATKLDGRSSEIYERACRICKFTTDDGFVTLCHGDMWSNNILFRKNVHSVDVKVVDFQQLFNGSPCHDLLRLLHGNSHEDLDETDWDQLMQQYYVVFAETLKKLRYPEHRIPTLIELRVHMLKLCVCEAFINVLVIGSRNFVDIEDDPIIHYIQNEPENRQFRLSALQRAPGTKVLHTLLRYFDGIGVFD